MSGDKTDRICLLALDDTNTVGPDRGGSPALAAQETELRASAAFTYFSGIER